jgi:IMP dehydrogenase/GMP reductase
MKFDFDDILIQPADISNIESRKQVNVFYEDGYLPLFTAPMDTVIDDSNYTLFQSAGIKVVRPRKAPSFGVNLDCGFNNFLSFGKDEFKKIFLDNGKLLVSERYYILIDIANGHMQSLLDMTREAKSLYGDDMVLMVGNIANPETYRLFSDAGADFARIGIGNGGGCLTTVQTGVGYPMASLIHECYQVSCELATPAKIVADGGFKSYADIIKALALGADHVMLGSILNKTLESAGDTYLANTKGEGWTEPGEKIDQYSIETGNLFTYGTKMFKKFRGMSTKEAQKAMGKTDLKTSEGVTRMQPVEYTLVGWRDNFISYLSSAMSYSNAATLQEFIGNAKWNMISTNSLNRFRK